MEMVGVRNIPCIEPLWHRPNETQDQPRLARVPVKSTGEVFIR
jgi:hypothetical protein